VAITSDALAGLGDRALHALRRTPLSRAALEAAIPGASPEALDEALGRLIASGAVRHAGGVLDLPQPDAEQARARQEAALAGQIAETLRRGGLAPPDPGSVAPRLLARLLRDGVIVRAHDSGQKRDVLFHREAIVRAQRSLAPLLSQPPGLLVSEIGAALGISRKYSVPLLEHLDATGFTRRLGNRRVLARPG